MSDLKLNRLTNDLDLTGSKLSLVDNLQLEALRQKIQIAVLLHRGEWFKNVNEGVPYLTDFVVVKNNKRVVDSFMRAYIAAIDGVEQLTSYQSTFTPITRTLNITFECTGIPDQIEINVEI